MTKMLELILDNHLRPEAVERIRVGTNHNMLNALIHHRPANALQAKFSMEFCMAILMIERRAGLAEFTNEEVNRPAVQAMIEKVDFHVHPEAEAAGYDKMTTILEIHCKDGTAVSGRADFGKGSPANPLTYDEVAQKFLDCAQFAGWPSGKVERVIETVRSLELLDDVRSLTKLLGS
jgi:2-methylcitrate dehydratase PrpD